MVNITLFSHKDLIEPTLNVHSDFKVLCFEFGGVNICFDSNEEIQKLIDLLQNLKHTPFLFEDFEELENQRLRDVEKQTKIKNGIK